MGHGRWFIALILAWSLSGCTAFMARQIETPGHGRGSLRPLDHQLEMIGFERRMLKIPDGVRIAYWIAPPRAYHVSDEYQVRRKGKQTSVSFKFRLVGDPAKAPLLAYKGSVVLLHPWSMSGAAMFTWGIHFAAAGYEVVMPDLRSQGDSSDAPVGYGPREAGDIAALVRHLRAKHQLPVPLYVLGASYGATVALFAAPEMKNLRGVIALEPFANAADVIRRAPASGVFGYYWLAHWITPRVVDTAIKRASRQLGIDLAQIDPGDALAQTPSCVLILRGVEDKLIADDGLRELVRRSARASYVEVSQEGHLSLPMRTDRLFPPLLKWMEALPVSTHGNCPAFTLPPVVTTPVANPRMK